MTQNKLAAVLKYGYSAISNYESGRNEPSIKDLSILANFFNVSLDYLLGASIERQRYPFDQSIGQIEKCEKLIDSLYESISVELGELLAKSKEEQKKEILQDLKRKNLK